MVETLLLEKATLEQASSFYKTVETVAKEQKFLATTEGFSLESSKKHIQSIIDKNYAQYFAIDADEVIGWCDIIPRKQNGMTHVGELNMGLLNFHRGQGIGSSLVKKAIEHARKYNKVERVEVEVFESNRYAVELYKRMGFNIEGRKPKARKIEGEYDNILIMGRIL